MSAIARFHEWPRYCTPQARDVVLNIVRSNSPLSSKDIFKLAIQTAQPASADTQLKLDLSKFRGHPPPQPTSPVRSIRYNLTVSCLHCLTCISRYLKKVVLPALATEKEVEKFHTKIVKQTQTTNVWLWRVKEHRQSRLAAVDASSEPPLTGTASLSPAAVGVGEDWSHLNKRRQRARERKVARDLARLSTLQAGNATTC